MRRRKTNKDNNSCKNKQYDNDDFDRVMVVMMPLMMLLVV